MVSVYLVTKFVGGKHEQKMFQLITKMCAPGNIETMWRFKQGIPWNEWHQAVYCKLRVGYNKIFW